MTHKILTSGGGFMVHISSSSIGIITPRHHQHQHMDRAQAIKQTSQPILPLSYSCKATFATKAHIYTKWQQSPRYVIQAHESLRRNFGSRGLEGQDVCSVKLLQFKVDKRNMLLDVSSPIPWTLTSQCVASNIW